MVGPDVATDAEAGPALGLSLTPSCRSSRRSSRSRPRIARRRPARVVHHVLPDTGDVAPARAVRGEQDKSLGAGTHPALLVLPGVGQRAEVGRHAGGDVGRQHRTGRAAERAGRSTQRSPVGGDPRSSSTGELIATATASNPDSGASPPPSATRPLTNSEKPARSSGRVKNGDSSQRRLTVGREIAEGDHAYPQLVNVLALGGQVRSAHRRRNEVRCSSPGR